MSMKNPLLEAQIEIRRQQLLKENKKSLLERYADSKPTPSKGLGDTIEKVFEKTGIKHVAKKALGEDCGCNKRKETLNSWFPYKDKK